MTTVFEHGIKEGNKYLTCQLEGRSTQGCYMHMQIIS